MTVDSCYNAKEKGSNLYHNITFNYKWIKSAMCSFLMNEKLRMRNCCDRGIKKKKKTSWTCSYRERTLKLSETPSFYTALDGKVLSTRNILQHTIINQMTHYYSESSLPQLPHPMMQCADFQLPKMHQKTIADSGNGFDSSFEYKCKINHIFWCLFHVFLFTEQIALTNSKLAC